DLLARHPDLKSRRSRAIDQSRKNAVDYVTLERWFELFRSTLLTYNVAEDDIYNVDEKGCMKGISDNTKVIVIRFLLSSVSRCHNPDRNQESGDREWIS
ncbi:hypothetical protein B0H67DRAFT_473215, partial [Lasiosphaeris hirsuta]